MKEGGEPAIVEGKNMNGFFRKVLFNNVASLFPTSLFQSVGGMERNIQVLHFTSEEEKCKYLDTSWEEEFSNQIFSTLLTNSSLLYLQALASSKPWSRPTYLPYMTQKSWQETLPSDLEPPPSATLTRVEEFSVPDEW
ncbi:hypothetical protein Anas_12941 [Armadillidium nasatum]|uniref:Uncharacterized protein n=1 Tax=Armadillidium nasatum TaxID=96803 RepID=A0A5N5T120_9CRUS|nr:hypothetical protein Anas_12941 [Armadillidium nasatum]